MQYDNNFSKILGVKRLKISRVSKDTGISTAIIRNFYYDRRSRMRLDAMIILCEYLDITLDDLIERTYEEELLGIEEKSKEIEEINKRIDKVWDETRK